MTYFYLATPFRRFPHGMDAAYRLACVEAARLIKAGIPTYSPIAQGQGLSDHGGLDPTDNDLWMAINKPLMESAKGIIVLEAESWSISNGMALEKAYFESVGKPVIAMQPGTIPAQLLGDPALPSDSIRFAHEAGKPSSPSVTIPIAAHEAWELVICEDGWPMVATAGDIVCVPEPNHTQPDAWDLRNFRLIAAAPDLLASLKELCRHVDGNGGTRFGLREYADLAIAKAQGIVTGTDETRRGSADRSEVEPGPKDAPASPCFRIDASGKTA